jgi:hypothetical protein
MAMQMRHGPQGPQPPNQVAYAPTAPSHAIMQVNEALWMQIGKLGYLKGWSEAAGADP